jgi:hypothetical protein
MNSWRIEMNLDTINLEATALYHRTRTSLHLRSSKSWYWLHFYHGEKHYQQNKTNPEAYCRGCIANKISELRCADAEAVGSGASMAVIRAPEDLFKDGEHLSIYALVG